MVMPLESMRLPLKTDAQAVVACLNEGIAKGFVPRQSNMDQGRQIDRYEVRPFGYRFRPIKNDHIPDGWGVYPRWSYKDRPELGKDFGGPFMIAEEAMRHLQRQNQETV